MTRHRVFFVFGAAWLAALLLSWWVYRRATAPSSRDIVHIVAAAHNLPAGQRVASTDMKLIEVARRDVPPGSYAQPNDVVDRALLVPVGANEPLLANKLAPRQGGDSLIAMIEPGKRAVTVQVNETTAVAGFVQPGTRVDVLFTRPLPDGDAATTTILQNVPVLAYGRNLQRPGAPGDSRPGSATGSERQATVTLLVTQDDAQKLALAMQRGKIQLALRNPLDQDATESEPVYSEDLGIEEPVRVSARSRGPAGAMAPGMDAPPAPPKPKDPKEGKIVIRVYRGSKVSEEIF